MFPHVSRDPLGAAFPARGPLQWKGAAPRLPVPPAASWRAGSGSGLPRAPDQLGAAPGIFRRLSQGRGKPSRWPPAGLGREQPCPLWDAVADAGSQAGTSGAAGRRRTRPGHRTGTDTSPQRSPSRSPTRDRERRAAERIGPRRRTSLGGAARAGRPGGGEDGRRVRGPPRRLPTRRAWSPAAGAAPLLPRSAAVRPADAEAVRRPRAGGRALPELSPRPRPGSAPPPRGSGANPRPRLITNTRSPAAAQPLRPRDSGAQQARASVFTV